jgi:hypothetical protein
MHDRVGIETRKYAVDGGAITNIAMAETIAWMALNRRQRGKIASVGQLVDDEDFVIGMTDQMPDECRPMKPAPPVTKIFIRCLRV